MAVRAICDHDVVARPKFGEATTFRAFAEMWTSGELHELYTKRIPRKKTSDFDDCLLRKWVYPHIGEVPIRAVTGDHCEDVLNAVPEERSEHLARHVAQVMSRILKLAAFPAKLIPVSPIPLGFLPRIQKKRARTYLYPSEDRALLGCTEIYPVLRLLYGVLAREGMRLEEALTLDLVDLDLQNGAVCLDKNKTDDPRTWALDPGVLVALRLWKKYFHPKPVPTQRVFVYPAESRSSGEPLASATRAEELRAHLKRAGCTRPQLFARDADRRPICVHDLRATFVTLALAADKTETFVADRTGHRSSKMIHGYRRQARSHVELRMGALAPLHEAIPEIAAVHANLIRGAAE